MSDMQNSSINKKRSLSPVELSVFCEQTAMMFQSGMMVHSGIQMMAEDTTDNRMKEILLEVSSYLSKGSPLHEALEQTNAFPDYMVYMVKIGNESGKPDVVMSSLSAYYARAHAMKENIKSAVVYPTVLVAMMLTVLVFLSVKVLPVFSNVFKSLGTEMSPAASAIMRFGMAIGKYSFAFLIAAVIIALAIFFFVKTEKGRVLWSDFLAKRKMTEKFGIASFASSMSLMLASGLDTDHALNLSVQMVTNTTVKNKIQKCVDILEDRQTSFVDALRQVDLFSNTTIGVLTMGSKAGNMDSAMQYVADIYEDDFQRSMMKKVSLIEPLSVAVVSILIGSVLISVMLPLLGVMSSIG